MIIIHTLSCLSCVSAPADIKLLNKSVEVGYRDPELQIVEVEFVKDGIAREPDEMLELELVITRGQEGTGENAFFLRNKTLTIVDDDSKIIIK